MAYRVNRFDAHSTNLVAGPFSTFPAAYAEYLNLRKNDPRGQYDIREEKVVVDIAAALAALELQAPAADVPEDEPLDIHVFHADDTVITSDGPLPLTPEPELAKAPVVIPSEALTPAPLTPGSDVIPS